MTPTDEAAQAVESFGANAADGLADVFDQAGDRIAQSLERAAKSGELSFNALAESIATDFARFAVDQLITAPLEGLVSSLTGSLSSALGGAGASKSAPVTVNLNMGEGASKPSFGQASEAQIAARVAQAVSRSQRRI